VLSAWNFWRLRYASIWLDESDNVVVGWLLSEGGRLYDTVFSHHLPLAYITSHMVAVISPNDDLAHFRLVPMLVCLATGTSILVSPVTRSGEKSWLAASLFVLATATLAPLWWGTLLLTDLLCGYLLVVFAACLWLPLCLGRAPGRWHAAAGGGALAAWVSGSLITVYPALIVAAMGSGLVLASAPHREAAVKCVPPALLGAVVVLALQFGWVLAMASLPGLVEQALVFNFEFYGPWQGYVKGSASALDVVTRGVADTLSKWTSDLWHPEDAGGWLTPVALVSSAGLGLAAAVSLGTTRRERSVAVGLGMTFGFLLLAATLRLRGEGSHAAPYYVWILGAGALSLALAPPKMRGGIAACALLLGATLVWSEREHLRFDRSVPALNRMVSARLRPFEYVREHTSPDERFLSINAEPLGYLIARRHPAHRAVFYLPWQAAWEASRSAPSSCEQVRANPPSFVYYNPTPVHGHSWESFGACFQQLIEELYEPTRQPAIRHLFQLRKRNDEVDAHVGAASPGGPSGEGELVRVPGEGYPSPGEGTRWKLAKR